MIIYNVTVKVEPSIATAWLQWIKEEHIPEMIATGCFSEGRVMRLLDVDDNEGPTYAVQYVSDNKEVYDRYIREFAEAMRKKGLDKWGHNTVAFRSVMELVN